MANITSITIPTSALTSDNEQTLCNKKNTNRSGIRFTFSLDTPSSSECSQYKKHGRQRTVLLNNMIKCGGKQRSGNLLIMPLPKTGLKEGMLQGLKLSWKCML